MTPSPLDAAPALIALDWGTTSLRACLLGRAGELLDERRSDQGVLAAAAGAGFDAVFERHAGDWLARHGPLPVVASGMVGSRQGWVEAPYRACPASLGDVAAALLRHASAGGAGIRVVPGLSWRGPGGLPDVMRGEETQIFGALAHGGIDGGDAAFVLPGTHSKWVRVESGRIEAFATFMTGELFAVLRKHSILGRLMGDGVPDGGAGEGNDGGNGDVARGGGAVRGGSGDRDSDGDGEDGGDHGTVVIGGIDLAFERGVATALDARASPGGLPSTLFSVRTLGLTGDLAPAALSPYLSGLLIGSEIAGARAAGFVPPGAPVRIVAAAALAALYRRALGLAGVACIDGPPTAAALGALAIARAQGLLP